MCYPEYFSIPIRCDYKKFHFPCRNHWYTMENEAVDDLQMGRKSLKNMKNHIKSHEIHVEKYEKSKNPSWIIQDTPETDRQWAPITDFRISTHWGWICGYPFNVLILNGRQCHPVTVFIQRLSFWMVNGKIEKTTMTENSTRWGTSDKII